MQQFSPFSNTILSSSIIQGTRDYANTNHNNQRNFHLELLSKPSQPTKPIQTYNQQTSLEKISDLHFDIIISNLRPIMDNGFSTTNFPRRGQSNRIFEHLVPAAIPLQLPVWTNLFHTSLSELAML